MVAILVCWLLQPVSNQELLANFAKAWDFFSVAENAKGLPWWSPMFLGGTSLAFAWSVMATNVLIAACSVPFGFLAGPKIAVAICLLIGACGCWAFAKSYAGTGTAGLAAAALFLLSPAVLTRAFAYEHFVVVCSMAFLPWAFWAVHRFVERPGTRTCLAAAAAYSAVMLSYGKTGVMCLPALALFGLVLIASQPSNRRPGIRFILLGVMTVVLLAVVPNLPALRESGFVAMFRFQPFEGWQHVFATKSALGWIDRDGVLTDGADAGYAPTTAGGGTYLGILVFLLFASAAFRGAFHTDELGKKARLFTVIAMLMFWMSFGPAGVFGGHLTFLSMSYSAPDFAPALAWFLLTAQVWLIFKLVPPGWPLRYVIATLASAIYVFVPGFRLIEWLPVYSSIRAPFDFFQVTGMLCVIFAAAVLFSRWAGAMRTPARKLALAAGGLALLAVDVLPYARPLYVPQMDRAVFQDFLETQNYLKSSPVRGRIFAFSGRYFYLLTPYLSKRQLVAEAFNNYLQQRNYAMLQGVAIAPDSDLRTYLNIAGISHVLIDKTDPDTSPDIRARFAAMLQVVFENKNFVVFENTSTLGQAFLAQDILRLNSPDIESGPAVLEAASLGFATIGLPSGDAAEPGLRGRIEAGRIEAEQHGSLNEALPLKRAHILPGWTFQRLAFAPPDTGGWLVLTQAWHPDWKAFANGKPRETHLACMAFPGVRVAKGESITFRFCPPWWYPVCAIVGILAWTAVIVSLAWGGLRQCS